MLIALGEAFSAIWRRRIVLRGVCNTEELVQTFIIFRRPWTRFQVLDDEGEKLSASRKESALYTLEANTTRNRRKSPSLGKGLLFIFNTSLRGLSKDLLEHIYNATLSMGLYNLAAKNDRDKSTRFD